MSFIYLFHCNAPLITLYDYPRRTTMLVALFSLKHIDYIRMDKF